MIIPVSSYDQNRGSMVGAQEASRDEEIRALFEREGIVLRTASSTVRLADGKVQGGGGRGEPLADEERNAGDRPGHSIDGRRGQTQVRAERGRPFKRV